MPQPENFWYPVVPVEVLRVDAQQFPRRQRLARRVQYVQRLVYELAQLAEALVHGPHVGRLLVRSLQRRAYIVRKVRTVRFHLPSSV